MNLREGIRRLALLLGVVGAILGGIASYSELQSVLKQRARHVRFEQLANSDIVQHERKAYKESDPYAAKGGGLIFKAPDDSRRWVPKSQEAAALQSGGVLIDDGRTYSVETEGIKVIHWTKDYGIESIETGDGQTLYPTPAPTWWTYFLLAFFPLIGFFIPWGAVRGIGWVGAGFAESSKQNQSEK